MHADNDVTEPAPGVGKNSRARWPDLDGSATRSRGSLRAALRSERRAPKRRLGRCGTEFEEGVNIIAMREKRHVCTACGTQWQCEDPDGCRLPDEAFCDADQPIELRAREAWRVVSTALRVVSRSLSSSC